ncbi:hypothetical protein U1Q18_010358 [Sarracenia purpurea var. burkii]
MGWDEEEENENRDPNHYWQRTDTATINRRQRPRWILTVNGVDEKDGVGCMVGCRWSEDGRGGAAATLTWFDNLKWLERGLGFTYEGDDQLAYGGCVGGGDDFLLDFQSF